MLSSELKKLKEQLQGRDIKIDKKKLLEELEKLDRAYIDLNESLSLSSGVCKCCGRPF